MIAKASRSLCATYQATKCLLLNGIRSTTRNQRFAYFVRDMACETLKYLRIVAPLPLHHQLLHSALALPLSHHHALLFYPHMRNKRRPPSLSCSGPAGSRFRRNVGPCSRSMQLLGLLSASGARPRVTPGHDDVGPASGLGQGCYNDYPGLGLRLGLTRERTQNLLQGRRSGRCVVEALAEGRSWWEESVERGSTWARDVLSEKQEVGE
jgi:hypothetical protein